MGTLPRPSDRRLAVRLTPDALRQVRAGHPWIFDGSITQSKGEGAPGDLAVVFDDRRAFAAIGLYDPTSPIRVRVLHRGAPCSIDRAFWARRLEAALAVRTPLTERPGTTGMRYLNGESDGFPGLVLDRYADCLVMKIYTPAWVPHLGDLAAVIEERLHPTTMVVRFARALSGPDLHGLEEGDALIGTAPTGPVLFEEAGLLFEADLVHGQKTGHFLDQRENRVLVGGRCDDAKVLDVFSATGGFSVHAAAGGASHVVSVDISEPTLAVASRNLGHNRHRAAVARCEHRPMVGDADEVMERLLRRGERFDVVVVDPPSFTPRQTSVDRALNAYARLADRAVRLVRPGGLYFQASCSSRVTAEQFHRTVGHAAARAGRPLAELVRTGHPIDHPVTFTEGAYLKAVLAEVP